MLEYKIGMNTTVIIGNSKTFVVNKWMVTPRGYKRKYNLDINLTPVKKRRQ